MITVVLAGMEDCLEINWHLITKLTISQTMAEAFWDVSKEIPLLEAIPKWRHAMENRVRWLPNVKQTWKLLPMDIRYAIDPEIAERSRRQRMLERERKSSGISHNVGTLAIV